MWAPLGDDPTATIRHDSQSAPRAAPGPSSQVQSCIDTQKYIVYICIDAAGPVARENQCTTMSQRLIVRVVSASDKALEGYKVFLCEPFDTLLDIFGKAGLDAGLLRWHESTD